METYTSYYKARKVANQLDFKTVKVCGGWAVMDWQEYNIWKKQK